MNSLNEALLLAAEHQKAGRLTDAEQVYRQIVQAEPNHASTHAHLGVLLHQQRDVAGAECSFREVVHLTPGDAQAHSNLGRVLYDMGRLTDAAECYRQAVRLAPRVAGHHFNLASMMQALGQYQAACDCYQKSLQLAPDHADTHNNLGIVLREMGNFRQSEAHYRRACELQPNRAAAFNNLAVLLSDQGRHKEAVENYRRATQLLPDFAEPFCNLSASLQTLGDLDEAVASANRALTLDANLAPAYCNLGICLQARGQVAEAIQAYRAGLSVNPRDVHQHSNLIYALNYLPGIAPQTLFDEHRAWGRLHADPRLQPSMLHANDRSATRRLRVGYVSGHFRDHAVAVFVEPILAAHDHAEFEVYCYSNSALTDGSTARFQSYADHWRPIAALSDDATSELIRRDQIDILVDLAGHITGNRLLVFARRPAPVQVTYIGYQNTTGMQAMDYRLTDAHADPPGKTDAYYTERLVRLPETFYCYRPEPAAPPVTPLPALVRGHITFGSFNHFSKVSQQVLETWAACLRAVANSRLLLLAGATPWMRSHLGQTFARAGVDPGRVDLVPRQSYLDYLRLLGEVDMALDSFPFNGHTTTCDCLWQGVPVVTLAADAYVSRFGSTAHMNLGLEDLIASDREEYLAIATRLATDMPRLEQLRAELRPRMSSSVLVDGTRFARQLEASYRAMWKQWCGAGA